MLYVQNLIRILRYIFLRQGVSNIGGKAVAGLTQSDAAFASCLDHNNKLLAARASPSCFTQSSV
jgi:hypothetical protein